MVIFMLGKRNTVLLTLLTGAFVSTAFTSNVYDASSSLSWKYNVSQTSVVTDVVSYDTNIDVPVIEKMVPQGLTCTDDYFLISAYDYNKKDDSCIYVIDKEGVLVNICSLNNKAHVGGIAYNSENDLLWVTGLEGNVNAYRASSIINRESAFPIYSELNVGNGLANYKYPFLNAVSFLTIKNGHLFVGNFSLSNRGFVKEYDISIDDKTRVLSLNYIRKFAIPNKVQGLSFYEKDNKEYIIFSRSYGKKSSSILQIYIYDESVDDYNDKDLKSVSLELPSMLEQTTISEDSLYSVYESCAEPYLCDENEPVTELKVNDLKEIVLKLTK